MDRPIVLFAFIFVILCAGIALASLSLSETYNEAAAQEAPAAGIPAGTGGDGRITPMDIIAHELSKVQ